MSIAERLKEARASLRLKQDELVAISGIPLNTYRKYEGGTSEPGSKALAGLAKAGIDLNWLITGISYVTDRSGKRFFEVPTPETIDDSVDGRTPIKEKVDSSPRINDDALVQAVCVSIQTAKPGETLEQSARRAVAFYRYCWDQGMITETGEGEGNLKSTA